MPIGEIIKLRDSGDEELKMAVLLALHCAPILKGCKAANIITVSKKEFTGIRKLLRGTNISCYFLKIGGGKAILYLYREKELENYLLLQEVNGFLRAYGYDRKDMRAVLEQLSERIGLYSDGTIEFPHEIGLFLGYPLPDVRGFIENSGQNYMYAGYWKVYHNVQKAVMLFGRYDKARESVLEELASGRKIKEIAI